MVEPSMCRVPQFWRELLESLRDQPALCIVGYDFHVGYGLPHFNDTIKGIWSEPDARNNPFVHPHQTSAVLRWADARRNIALRCADYRSIPAYANRKVIAQLGYLQHLFGWHIADQSSDGFLATNGIADVIELYGCVMRGRCSLCASGASFWGCDASGMPNMKCPTCGGALFPDIAMFGWNQQDDALRLLDEAVAISHHIILVGVDRTILPFGRDGKIVQDKRIVEFKPGCLVLGGLGKPIPLIEMAKAVYEKNDAKLKDSEKATGSIDETIGVFYDLCREWEVDIELR